MLLSLRKSIKHCYKLKLEPLPETDNISALKVFSGYCKNTIILEQAYLPLTYGLAAEPTPKKAFSDQLDLRYDVKTYGNNIKEIQID